MRVNKEEGCRKESFQDEQDEMVRNGRSYPMPDAREHQLRRKEVSVEDGTE